MRKEFSTKAIYGNKIRTNNNDIRVFSNMWVEFLKNKVEGDVYAIYSNYQSDHTGDFDFLIGTEEVVGSSTVTIPEGEYYVWEVATNDMEAVGKAWNEIWKSDLPRTYNHDFELYKTDGSISIYLSVSNS
ncbi:effector binding domain-containing protein [Psychrobacillus sp. FSL H8-0484]|uniref:GyrI-like domain-containing protein n=1 Tax=Psychrobacillus sp. FSL H8-0484 TaxID=2921390 RepID=UPI0030FB2974